jgi:hypothetical protein
MRESRIGQRQFGEPLLGVAQGAAIRTRFIHALIILIWQKRSKACVTCVASPHQDYDIQIKDFSDVQVGNWKDWQPKGGKEDLQSNLTPEVEKLASEI